MNLRSLGAAGLILGGVLSVSGKENPESVFNEAYGSDLAQRIDVIVPEVQGDFPLPVCVFFHGGAWSHGDKLFYRTFARSIAREGFIVATPNYRLFPLARYPEFMNDAAAAVSWVVKNAERFGADPSRLVLGGHSAGGHMAVLLALEPSFLEAEGISCDRIRAVTALAPPIALDEKRWKMVQPIFGKDCAPGIVHPARLSEGDHPPIFLTAGRFDPVVPEASVERAYSQLDQIGGPVEFASYPWRGHVSVQPFLAGKKAQGKPYRDLIEFLNRAVPR